MTAKNIVKKKIYLCTLTKAVRVGRRTLFGNVKLRGDVLTDIVAKDSEAVSSYEAV